MKKKSLILARNILVAIFLGLFITSLAVVAYQNRKINNLIFAVDNLANRVELLAGTMKSQPTKNELSNQPTTYTSNEFEEAVINLDRGKISAFLADEVGATLEATDCCMDPLSREHAIDTLLGVMEGYKILTLNFDQNQDIVKKLKDKYPEITGNVGLGNDKQVFEYRMNNEGEVDYFYFSVSYSLLIN